MADTSPGARLGRAALLALAVIFVDQATKWAILHQVMLPPRVLQVFPGFNLTLTFNTGVSFGLFSGEAAAWQPLVLSALAVLVVIVLAVWLWREGERWKTPAVGLIAGGALGNVVDRLLRPGVVDFLDFHLGAWHWPAFNIADSAITIGVALLLGASLFPRAAEGTSEGAKSDAGGSRP